jgi:amidase
VPRLRPLNYGGTDIITSRIGGAVVTDELRWVDAVGQADLVRSGDVSAAELTEMAIARIELLDPSVNALVFRRFERARKEAATGDAGSPFGGVPFLLKDAVQHSEGDRYQHGMRFLRDHPWTSPHDSELTRRYKAAGFVVLGRTNVPELTVSSTTEPLAFGPTRNPWSPTHSAGGSSGGSAAAVASGMVPVAHGNDMGGSIRIPASCCGLVGLKPSRDRTSLAPDFGEYWGPLTHEHVVTRTVRDCAAVLDVTAGPVPGDLHMAPPPARPWLEEVGREPERLRVGLFVEAPSGGPVDPLCAAAATGAARRLEAMGHEVGAFDGPTLFDREGSEAMGIIIAAGLARDVRRWEERLGATVAEMEPLPALMVESGQSVTATQLVAAVDRLARWSRAVAAATSGFDVVLSPTMAMLPPELGTLSGDNSLADMAGGLSAMTSFAIPFDISGQPAISLPLSWAPNGLPIGVQFVAPYGREDVLFRLASRLEESEPWADRRPDMAWAT